MKEDENNNKNKLSNNIFVDQICDSDCDLHSLTSFIYISSQELLMGYTEFYFGYQKEKN